MSLILVFTLATLRRYIRVDILSKRHYVFLSLYASIMSGRTLYVGSSHLVPVEMVWPPQVFTHYPGWERQARRRVLAADLPPGTLDVKGGRTVAETIPWYRQVSKSLATWRAVHPYPLTRVIILLGGNDLVTLTEEYLKDSRVSRKKCLTLIADPQGLRERARKIATDLITLRGLLLQYIPDVYVCTVLPRSVPTTISYDYAISIINLRLGDGIPPAKLIRLHDMVKKEHLCHDGIHLNRRGTDILTMVIQSVCI